MNKIQKVDKCFSDEKFTSFAGYYEVDSYEDVGNFLRTVHDDLFWKVTYHTGLSDTHITSIFAKSLKWLEFETANGPFNKNSMFINFSIGDGFFKQKKKFTIGKTFILNQPFSTEPLTIKVSWDPNKENLVFSYSTNKGDVIWKCSKNDRGINLIGKRRKNEPHARLSMKRIYSTNDEDGAKS